MQAPPARPAFAKLLRWQKLCTGGTRRQAKAADLVVQQLLGLYLGVEVIHVLFRPRAGQRDFREADGATATEGGMEATIRELVTTDILHVLDALGVCAIFTCHSAFPLGQGDPVLGCRGRKKALCVSRREKLRRPGGNCKNAFRHYKPVKLTRCS